MGHPLWPLFDLRIATPRVELRLPTDDDLIAQMEVVRAGIHDRDLLPFNLDWAGRPSPDLEQGYIQHHWGQRAAWRPDDWNLVLSAFVDGRPVGSQSIGGRDFGRVRSVMTGSWLGRAHQGQGLGTEMRAGVLELAFAHLDAVEARSTVREGNAASFGVSRRLGYEPDGTIRTIMSDEVAVQHILVLTRRRWQEHRPEHPITVTGLDHCLELFGR